MPCDRTRRALGLLALSFGLAASPVVHSDELDILKGQTIRVVIGGDAGQGTDAIARAFFSALERYLPETSIRLQNIEGGSGIQAVKEVQEATDSYVTVGVFNNGPIYSQLTSTDVLPFDLSTMKWVGSLTENQRLVGMRGGLGAPDFATLVSLDRQPIAVVPNAGSSGHVESLLLNALTDLRLKVVPGVKEGERQAMILAGDADVMVASRSQLLTLITPGELVPVLKYDNSGYPEDLAALPTISDVARPGAAKEVVQLMETLNGVGRMIAAAPATEQAVVEALRVAFDKVTADDGYDNDLTELDVVNSPGSGADLEARMQVFFGGSGSFKALLAQYIECGQAISDGEARVCN